MPLTFSCIEILPVCAKVLHPDRHVRAPDVPELCLHRSQQSVKKKKKKTNCFAAPA